MQTPQPGSRANYRTGDDDNVETYTARQPTAAATVSTQALLRRPQPQPPSSSMFDILWHTGRHYVTDPGDLARLRRCSRGLYATLPPELLYAVEVQRSRALHELSRRVFVHRPCRNCEASHRSLLVRPPGDPSSAGQLHRVVAGGHHAAFDRLLKLATEGRHRHSEYTLAWMPGHGSALEVALRHGQLEMAERLVEVAEKFRTGSTYTFNIVDVQLDKSPWDMDPLPGSDVSSFKMPKGARWMWRQRAKADKMQYDPDKDRDCHILGQLKPRDQWDTATQLRTGVIGNNIYPPSLKYDDRKREEVFAETVLDLAIMRGQADLARRLVDLSHCSWRPVPPWAPPVRSNRSSVLHLAARAGMTDVVAALIQRNTACDDRAPRMGGFRPLQCAAVREGNGRVILHLANRNARLRYRTRGKNPGKPRAAGSAWAEHEHENGNGIEEINDESDHRNMAPLVLALQQGCLSNARLLLTYELMWLQIEFHHDLPQAQYHIKRRIQQLLLKCVKTDKLLEFTKCLLVCYDNSPKNLCLPAIRRAKALARKPPYSNPDTAPNRRTVWVLGQAHATYRPTRPAANTQKS